MSSSVVTLNLVSINLQSLYNCSNDSFLDLKQQLSHWYNSSYKGSYNLGIGLTLDNANIVVTQFRSIHERDLLGLATWLQNIHDHQIWDHDTFLGLNIRTRPSFLYFCCNRHAASSWEHHQHSCCRYSSLASTFHFVSWSVELEASQGVHTTYDNSILPNASRNQSLQCKGEVDVDYIAKKFFFIAGL